MNERRKKPIRTALLVWWKVAKQFIFLWCWYSFYVPNLDKIEMQTRMPTFIHIWIEFINIFRMFYD